MRSKSVLLLTLALGCGLVASIGISQVMDKRSGQTPSGETEPVFVAMVDIPFNEELSEKNIKLEEWPKGKVPSGSVVKLEDVEKKRTRTKLFAGEPILVAKLVGAGESSGIVGEIPKGFRVVSVRIDAVAGTSGLIEPGNRVDVMVHLNKNPSVGIPDTTTTTVLQDVAVFAVDTVTLSKRQNEKDEQPITAKTVSLLLTPNQSAKVMLATELGTIRLVLRGTGDNMPASTAGVLVADILGTAPDKGDRKKESDELASRPEKTEKKPGILDFIKREAPAIKIPEPPQPEFHPWKMVLLKGGEVTQLEFADDQALPLSTPVAPPSPASEPASDKPAPEEQPEPEEQPAPPTTGPDLSPSSDEPASDAPAAEQNEEKE